MEINNPTNRSGQALTLLSQYDDPNLSALDLHNWSALGTVRRSRSGRRRTHSCPIAPFSPSGWLSSDNPDDSGYGARAHSGKRRFRPPHRSRWEARCCGRMGPACWQEGARAPG